MGRADLHIHSLASDGVSSVAEILEHAAERGGLDVIAITDHERDRRRGRRAAHGRGARPARRGRSSARRSPPAAATSSALFLDEAHPAVALAQVARSPASTTRAAWPSSPIRWCPIRCAPAAEPSASCSTRPIPRSTRTASRRSTRPPAGMRWTAACRRSWTRSAWPPSAAATPTAPRTSARP